MSKSKSLVRQKAQQPVDAGEGGPVAGLMSLLVDRLSDSSIVFLDAEGRVLTWNATAERIRGWQAKEIVGHQVSRLLPAEQIGNGNARLAQEIALKEGHFEEEGWRVRKDGTRFWANVVLTALKDQNGILQGFGEITRDLTRHRKAAEDSRMQTAEILEMATVPIVQVWEGVVLVPLIGTLDSQRTQHLMERLLQRITDTNSPVAVLDITGVPTIDTQTAQHLIETISAVRLLGAEVILTGVRPVIAQTLVHLGIDLSNVVTRSVLAGGLRVALNSLNLCVTAKTQQPAAAVAQVGRANEQ